MKRIVFFAVILIALFAWPPIYHHYLARPVRNWATGQGKMQDFEIQQLLNLQRWEIDIPKDKNGWYLSLEAEIESEVKTWGGVTVSGGTRVVLLTRRNSDSKRIEYAWYSTDPKGITDALGTFLQLNLHLRSMGSGSVPDPMVDASVSAGRPDGIVMIGEPIYRGGRKSVLAFPGVATADFEVHVVLVPPYEAEQKNLKTSGSTEVSIEN
jgi:hypothetical protein